MQIQCCSCGDLFANKYTWDNKDAKDLIQIY